LPLPTAITFFTPSIDHLRPEVDVDGADAGDALRQGTAYAVADLVLERASGGREDHRQRDHPTRDLDVADHPQLHEVLVQLRVFNSLERLEDVRFGDLWHTGVYRKGCPVRYP
jgi:hypothetical protein